LERITGIIFFRCDRDIPAIVARAKESRFDGRSHVTLKSIADALENSRGGVDGQHRV
jgi:hypothetical protein